MKLAYVPAKCGFTFPDVQLALEAGEVIESAAGDLLDRQATIGPSGGCCIVWFEWTPGTTAIDLRRSRASDAEVRPRVLGAITAAASPPTKAASCAALTLARDTISGV